MSATTLMPILGVMLLLGAGIALGVSLNEHRRVKRVRQLGVDGEAVITGKKIRRMVGRQIRMSDQYVTYCFDASGLDGHLATYTSGQPVSAETFSALSEGDKVAIRYLPANPAGTAELAGNFTDASAVSAQNSYAFGCLIGGVILLLIPLLVSGTAADETAIQLTATAKSAAQTSATAAQLATERADGVVVRAALEPNLAEWKQVTDQAVHQVSSAEVGLSRLNLETIVYGYCRDGAFYVIAPGTFHEGRTSEIHSTDGYSYSSKNAVSCNPPNWILFQKADLGDGWAFVNDRRHRQYANGPITIIGAAVAVSQKVIAVWKRTVTWTSSAIWEGQALIQGKSSLPRFFGRQFLAPKRRRIWLALMLTIVVIATGIILFAVSQRNQADKIISAVRTSFPDFCRDGQILTEIDLTVHLPPGRYWGIRCDSWLKPPGFYCYATDIDLAQCTTARPLVATLGRYADEFEAINRSNGQRMHVCPSLP